MGTLYVVATPIGNLGDASARMQQTLAAVALVAAEDTRHTGALLAGFGAHTPLVSLHEHNEEGRIAALLERLRQGEDIALVSDAGTPLLADPGYRLVRATLAASLPVRPIPGPCALIAALSVAGLPTDRFLFAGFLPARSGARVQALGELLQQPATLVFYEAPHRIAAALVDAAATLGETREAWVGRELTKRFETHYRGALGELARHFAEHPADARGEFVFIVAGATTPAAKTQVEAESLLRLLLEELPASRAARLAARITGQPRQALYQQALVLGGE